jgi:hypothetical protein
MAPVAGNKESYAAKLAREGEARRLAKLEAAERQAREDALLAQRKREADQAKREQTKALLAAEKARKAEAERQRVEEELAAQRAAKKAAADTAAKRKAEKEEQERARIAKEEAEAAEATAAAAAAAEAKRKKKRATKTEEPSVAPVVTEPAPPLAVTATPTTPKPTPTPTPALPAAAAIAPAKPKATRAPVPPRATTVEFGVQTDPFELDATAPVAWVGRQKYTSTEEERLADAAELAELHSMSLRDQVAKLLLDARYNKLRIRGLDEEAAASLARNKELKNELLKARSVIKQQNEELKEWRDEGAKMVSTGEKDADAEAAAADATGTTAPKQPVATELSTSVFPVLPGVSAQVFSIPPSLLSSCAGDLVSLNWLRSVWEALRNLEQRRRDAERVTAETIQKGRMAELNLVSETATTQCTHAPCACHAFASCKRR